MCSDIFNIFTLYTEPDKTETYTASATAIPCCFLRRCSMPAWLRNDEERRQLFAALRSTPPPEPVRGLCFFLYHRVWRTTPYNRIIMQNIMKISIDSINSIVWIVSIHVVFKFMNVLGIIWIDFHEMLLFPIFSFYQVALYHLAKILPTSCQGASERRKRNLSQLWTESSLCWSCGTWHVRVCEKHCGKMQRRWVAEFLPIQGSARLCLIAGHLMSYHLETGNQHGENKLKTVSREDSLSESIRGQAYINSRKVKRWVLEVA